MLRAKIFTESIRLYLHVTSAVIPCWSSLKAIFWSELLPFFMTCIANTGRFVIPVRYYSPVYHFDNLPFQKRKGFACRLIVSLWSSCSANACRPCILAEIKYTNHYRAWLWHPAAQRKTMKVYLQHIQKRIKPFHLLLAAWLLTLLTGLIYNFLTK